MCIHVTESSEKIEVEVNSITAYKRGHPIIWENGEWFYEDTKEPADDNRPCVKCGEMPTEDGHDPCIPDLPGVENACCGHGVELGYVQFEDGSTIRGEFALVKREDGKTINFHTE